MTQMFRLVGEKGSGKTTVAHGLAMVLEGSYPLGAMAHVCSEGIVSLWSREAKDFECTELDVVPSDVVAVFREYLPVAMFTDIGAHDTVIVIGRMRPTMATHLQRYLCDALDAQAVSAIANGA